MALGAHQLPLMLVGAGDDWASASGSLALAGMVHSGCSMLTGSGAHPCTVSDKAGSRVHKPLGAPGTPA